MRIWHKPITVELLNERGKGTLSDFLGITFVAITDDTITAIMPASDTVKQPIGIVHGGANVVLAETLASTAANAVIHLDKQFCVGLEINANHIRSVRSGLIRGVTKPIHIGRSTHVWGIELFDEADKLTCVSRMTASVMTRS